VAVVTDGPKGTKDISYNSLRSSSEILSSFRASTLVHYKHQFNDMGLDFQRVELVRHRVDGSWSYTGFNDFRERLAKQIGIKLREMDGFCDSGKPWDEVTDDIAPLLNHSDCDGKLSASECERIAKRLRELVKNWDDGDYDKQNAVALADAMETCGKDGEGGYIQFC
jgi:hypothetical protein